MFVLHNHSWDFYMGCFNIDSFGKVASILLIIIFYQKISKWSWYNFSKIVVTSTYKVAEHFKKIKPISFEEFWFQLPFLKDFL